MGYSMRTARYRFTRWQLRKDPQSVVAMELYDHRNDPQENVNIAHDLDHKQLVEKLSKQYLQGWQGALPR